jgi:hypothetical protein
MMEFLLDNRSTDNLRRATSAIKSRVEGAFGALRFGYKVRRGNRDASIVLVAG